MCTRCACCLIVALLVFLPVTRTCGQTVPHLVFSGHVYDAETGAPLPGANVFIAGTTRGAATDDAGYFVIPGLALGTHELVVSFLGYEGQSQRVRVTTPEDRVFEFRLSPAVLKTEGVEVIGLSDHEREKRFKTFKKYFLGVSRNASQCEVLNPEVLDYEVDDASGRFLARARAPLQIENRALGYLLHFVLDEFELRESRHFIRYRGRVGFTEMVPRDDDEVRRWKERRERAYQGSLRHFLSALVRDALWEEGFLLLSEEESRQAAYAGVPGNRPASRVKGLGPEDILTPGELPFERRLRFPGYLKVIYYKELPSGEYLKFRQFAGRRLPTSEDEQVSYIALNQPGALITTDGRVEDTYAITKFGYWFFERVAELLPEEYRPFSDTPAPVEAATAEDWAPVVRRGIAAVREGRYEAGEAALAPVMAAAPDYVLDGEGSVAYWLGRAHAAREQWDAALRVWSEGSERLRLAGRFDPILADSFVEQTFSRQNQDAYVPAVAAYFDLLLRADRPMPEAVQRVVLRHLTPVLPLLTDAERGAVVDGTPGPLLQGLRLHPGAGAYLVSWWQRRDPLPASALNEAVAEHLARVAYARANYAFDGSPQGFDDRGAAYVRYGPPYVQVSIPVDLAHATQVLRENAYPLPGAIIPPMNEFWTYRHVDDLIHYLFILDGGRYQEASPEDLIPRELKSAHKRVGRGHSNPATLDNPNGTQTPSNQALAEALFETWKSIYTQLAIYHPDYEKQVEELAFHESDLQATRAGANSITASALSFVNGAELRFDALAREAVRKREEEAPRRYSRLLQQLRPLPVEVRLARFMDPDGSTRTTLFWSHRPGTLALNKDLRAQLLPPGSAPPERFFVEMVANLHTRDFRARTPTGVTYLAANVPQGEGSPVQTIDLVGSTAPYHISVQWDEFMMAEDMDGQVAKGAYLRTGVAHMNDLAPLNADPGVLEMSDLVPVLLKDRFRPAGIDERRETAPDPYPYRTLDPEMPLGLLFEIYHLTYGEDDQAHYTVEYEIVRDPDRRGEKRTSVQTASSVDATTARETMGVDLGVVERDGPITIIVRVTDTSTGQTVERDIGFALKKARPD